MPHRNRVTPFGEIVAVPARGTVFGNRGILHDDDGRLIRDWQVRRWLACRLQFKGWHREILQPRSYTELFFLDEATALAAGHRPCAECRHADFVLFRDTWIRVRGTPVRADDIDRSLHAERLGPGREKRMHRARSAGLPDGTMVALDVEAWLVLGDRLLRWSPSGYGTRTARPATGMVDVLTPSSTVAVIRAGYRPGIHPSATA